MSEFNDELGKNKRIVSTNELAFALLTYIPITPGHTLIIPRREVATFAELTSAELSAISELTRDVMLRLTRVLGAEGFNCAWNQGSQYGQSVPHFHLHIVPRTPGDDGIKSYEPREFLYRPGSRAQTPDAELAEIASMLADVA